MLQIWHMPKLHDVYLWRKYANIYTTYEITPINDVAKTADNMYQ